MRISDWSSDVCSSDLGVRDNLLVGYGLVVGLNGTGETLTNTAFTEQSLIGMLERLGINTRGETLKTTNVPATKGTATLPSFARQRTRIETTVSALGYAQSLIGGALVVPANIGAAGVVPAVTQGQTERKRDV